MQPARKSWRAPFFTIWGGQAFSLFGSQLAQFALVWWLTETTGSATVLAMATLVALLPQIFLGPVMGALVDRWNRRVVLIVADGFIALVGIWLAYLFWSDALQIWHVYLVMLARALGGAVHWPAMQASTSLLVPKKELARVSGLNQTLYGLLNITAPPLGALLMEWLPLHNIMLIDVATAALAIAPLFFIQIPQPRRTGKQLAATSLWGDMWAGFQYIWGWPGALGICVLAMALNFFVSPAMRLLPILVQKHFLGGAMQLGWLNAAWGVGMLAGGLWLSLWGGTSKRIVLGLAGIVGLGVGILLVGLAPATWLAMALGGLFLGAVMNALSNGVLLAMLQELVDLEMQGRVFAVIGSLTAAMIPLGMLIAGPVADAIGARPIFIIAGVAQIALGVGSFFVPVIIQVEENQRPASGGEGEKHAVEES